MCSLLSYKVITSLVVICFGMKQVFGQGAWNICTPTTVLISNTTVYIASPGYPNRMENSFLECSCLILPLTTNNAPLRVTARYVDWNVDSFLVSKWGTLTFVTDDSGNNDEFDLSADVSGALTDKRATGLVVNLWRMYTLSGRSGYFKLEINFTDGESVKFNVTCIKGYQHLPPTTIPSTASSSSYTTTYSRPPSQSDSWTNTINPASVSTFSTIPNASKSITEVDNNHEQTPAARASSPLTSGAIAGIVVGSIMSIAFAIIILFLILYYCKRRKQILSSYQKPQQNMQTFSNSMHIDNDLDSEPTYEDAEQGGSARNNCRIECDSAYECTNPSNPVNNEYELEANPTADCCALSSGLPNNYDMEIGPNYELAQMPGDLSDRGKYKNHAASIESLQLVASKTNSVSSLGSNYADMNRGSIKANSPPTASTGILSKPSLTSAKDKHASEVINSPNVILEEDVPCTHTYTNVETDQIKKDSERSGNDNNIYVNTMQTDSTDQKSSPVYSEVNRETGGNFVLREGEVESGKDVEAMTHDDEDMLLIENSIYVS